MTCLAIVVVFIFILYSSLVNYISLFVLLEEELILLDSIIQFTEQNKIKKKSHIDKTLAFKMMKTTYRHLILELWMYPTD